MDEALRAQRDFALGQLEDLTRRGRQLHEALAANPHAASSLAAARTWQQAAAAAIHQLAGGSKAHWLSRAFSGALLIRSAEGGAVVEANVGEIVDRILDVLTQASTSLSSMDVAAPAPAAAAPAPRRFDFVHNVALRPVLEQAFTDSHDAVARGEFGLALILSCGVIDALLTDALDHARPRAQDAPEGLAHRSLGGGGSFERRIAAAEHAGLIRGGCARLPPVARTYRDLTDADGELRAGTPVSEREARLAGQVLRVVMRDLDPGR